MNGKRSIFRFTEIRNYNWVIPFESEFKHA